MLIEGTRPTIALSTEVHKSARAMFEASGIQFELFDKMTPLDELADFVNEKGAGFLGKRSNPKLSREFLESTGLYTIGCYCKETGIDIEAADDLGITVTNSPEGNSDAVGEYVAGMAIALSRGLITGDHMAQRQKWGKHNGQEVAGSTLGLIGFGAAGKRAAKKLHALGMNVVFWDADEGVESNEYATRLDNADEVIEAAHVLSLHIPGKGNEGFFDKSKLDMMPDGAILINTSRYEIMDDDAVEAALDSDSGKLGGLAIDVHTMPEPSKFGDSFASRFRGKDNTVVTCHQAGSGINAQLGTAGEVTDYLIDNIWTGNTEHSLNMPTIELGPVLYGARLLLPHRNHPGVIGEIGTLLGQHGINIEAMDNKPKYPVKERPDGLVYGFYDTDGAEFTPEVFEAVRSLDFVLRPRITRPQAQS